MPELIAPASRRCASIKNRQHERGVPVVQHSVSTGLSRATPAVCPGRARSPNPSKCEERGEPFDRVNLDPLPRRPCRRRGIGQVDAGLDIVSDGEFSKASYGTYIQQRLTGYGEADPSKLGLDRNIEFEAFPEYYERTRSRRGLRPGGCWAASARSRSATASPSIATSPISRTRRRPTSRPAAGL